MARLHPTAWAMYASEGAWQNARHFDYLADRVMEMRDGRLKRLCVSMPPGHGKSEYLSLYVASWWLATRPESRVVVASYGKSLAVGWSQRARDLLADLGPDTFGVHVNGRQSAEYWHVRDDSGAPRGSYFAVGRGGALTGKRAELLIVDDLIKDAMEAGSPATRQAAWEWFDQVAMTRLLPHSCVIVIATRWHHDDPIGRLERKAAEQQTEETWQFVNFPALATEEHDPLGRSPGDALWPELWPAEALRKKERGRDPYTWSSLYQGRPTPLEGALFKASWLRDYTRDGSVLHWDGGAVEISRLRVFATVDLAGSSKARADYTVISTWGVDDRTRLLFLLDVTRGRLEAPEIVRTMRAVQEQWSPVAFFCEDAGPQLNLVHKLRLAEWEGETVDPADKTQNTLVERLTDAGLPVVRTKPDVDKVTRAMPAVATLSNGRLLIPSRAPWRSEWITELVTFPESRHDDQVDTLSAAIPVYLRRLRSVRDSQPAPRRDGKWKIGRRR